MRVTRVLPCKLTDAEVAARADLISAHTKSYVTVEDEKKSTAKEFKERLDEIWGDIIKLTRQVDARAEERAVECEERYDLNRWAIAVVRLDTGEQVGAERNMTPEEQERVRQMDLNLAKPSVMEVVAPDLFTSSASSAGEPPSKGPLLLPAHAASEIEDLDDA